MRRRGRQERRFARSNDGLLDLSIVERPVNGADSASWSIRSVAAFARCVVTRLEPPRGLWGDANVT